MLIIGSHVSFGSEQLLGCAKAALSYGANAFMFYTGAPQNTLRSKINSEMTMMAQQLMQENGINLDHVICHAPYIINLANDLDPDKYQFSINFLKGEISRCMALGVKYLVVHPGSHVTLAKEVALANIIKALDIVINPEVMILLETMAGKGTEMGANLEEIASIIEGVSNPQYLGVCLDTCHLNDAGLDIKTFDQYLALFDERIGLDKIKCCHLNDSKNIIGSHKDRHANLGYGTIGFENLLGVVYHEQLKKVPKILETPYIEEKAPYKWEIAMLKAKSFNSHLSEDVINN